jgi:circadian clock protein KaiC
MVDGVIELVEQIIAPRTQSYLRVQKFRGSSFLRGHHAYNITDDGMHVFPRLEAAYANTSRDAENRIEKVTSGIESFDEMLFGGLPASTSTALIGPTGACKTTMGLQFLSKATPAEPGLHFGFFETPALLRRKAASIEIDLPALEASGAVEMVWQVQGENQLDMLGHRLLDAVERRGVKRLCVDSLDGMFQSETSPDRIHRFFAVLATELRARGVTAIYTLNTEGAYGDGTAQSSGISSLFENLILLRREEYCARMLRSISVLKLRDSDFNPMAKEFIIDHNGIRITRSLGEAESSNGKTSSKIL